jgi:hypothetical protein
LAPMDSEAGSNKPLSQALAHSATSLSMIGRGIPLISSYMGMASWAMRKLSGYASAFGFSKPYVGTAVNRMVPTNYTFQGNADGHDSIYSVGMLTDAHVTPTPLGGTDVDEMSFDYVLGQYSLISNGTLSSSDAFGQIKYACFVAPNAMYYQATYNTPVSYVAQPSGTALSILTSPCFYLGQSFSLWQGTFRFRIKIAKTKFHTGRIMLFFLPLIEEDTTNTVPGQFAVPNASNLFTMDFDNKIWDLREGNVMEFDVPWISRFPYLPCSTSIGNFIITIIEPLAGPAAVASAVPFAVEMKCLPGFQFQVPSTPRLYTTAPGQTTYVAQGIIADERKPTDAQHSIGEQISSVKQLIIRACPVTYLSQGSSSHSVLPWFISSYTSQVPATGAPTSAYLPSPLTWQNYLTNMYVYVRGSTVCDTVVCSGTGFPTLTAAQIGPTLYNTGSSAPQTYTSASAIVESLSRALHFVIPYYNFTSRSLLRAGSNVGTFSVPLTTNYVYTSLRQADSSNTNDAFVYTRASDDSQLGFFIGSPPLDLRSTLRAKTAFETAYDGLLTNATL